jgi:hypothetical protein
LCRIWRHLFGAEPKDAEVLDFVNHTMLRLMADATQFVDTKPLGGRRLSPKRMAREVAREVQQRGIFTFAQEAIKLELLHRKKERKTASVNEKRNASPISVNWHGKRQKKSIWQIMSAIGLLIGIIGRQPHFFSRSIRKLGYANLLAEP